MVKLYNKATDQFLGEISEDQLEFLTDELEEESSSDQDYYLNQATLEIFEEEGIDEALLRILQDALGEEEEVEIRWSRD